MSGGGKMVPIMACLSEQLHGSQGNKLFQLLMSLLERAQPATLPAGQKKLALLQRHVKMPEGGPSQECVIGGVRCKGGLYKGENEGQCQNGSYTMPPP